MNEQTDNSNSIDSLVCPSCWRTLFAPASFQKARTAEGTLGGFSYTTTWKQLQASADKGCHWCRLVTDSKDRVRRDKARALGKEATPEEVMGEEVGVRLCFVEESFVETVTPAGRHAAWVFVDSVLAAVAHVHTTAEDTAARYITARDMVLDVASESSYQLASQCLSECARHDLCPKPQPGVLPTRVVDCSQPSKPKLLITNGAQDFYAALSYVWGEPQPHNAIETTHKLGLRYLWVDALCILQDSKEDKRNEIAQMRRIFRDAYVSIIAASAQKVSDGFLHARPALPAPLRLPYQCPDGKLGSMWFRGIEPAYNPEDEPVNKRAWCLEERILSPRALIYASPTLQYHCQTQIVNVGHALHTGDRLHLPTRHKLFPSIPSPASLRQADLVELREIWHGILADYTSRALTKPADKLIAISGVVDLFQRLWGGEYVAGLWRQNLLEDLVWSREDEEPRLPRPKKWRAPSWSWAAVDGVVRPGSDQSTSRYTFDYEAEILECVATPKSERLPYGEVADGFVKLRAIVRKVVWDPVDRGSLLEPVSSPRDASGLRKDGKDAGEVRKRGHVLPDCAEEASQAVGGVYFVLLRLSRNLRSPYLNGLIVVPTSKAGCFRRVGMMRGFFIPEWYEGADRQMVVIV